MTVPGWFEFLLLSGAAFRVWRLIGADTLTEPLRDRVTRLDELERGGYRRGLDEWLHCPWCLGFWVILLWWGLWLLCPGLILWLSVPLAASALIALVAQTFDR